RSRVNLRHANSVFYQNQRMLYEVYRPHRLEGWPGSIREQPGLLHQHHKSTYRFVVFQLDFIF
ncbi:hypothetical protein HN51_028765, partial [Arachis hypogaea]